MMVQAQVGAARGMRQRLVGSSTVVVVVILATLWTAPSIVLLVASLRSQDVVQDGGWWSFSQGAGLTLDAYRQVFEGPSSAQHGITPYLFNSLAVAVPAVVLPLAIACLAAYALAWMHVKWTTALLLCLVSLQLMPIQVVLVPLVRFFDAGWSIGPVSVIPAMELGTSYVPLWVAHTVFALPLAILLLYGSMLRIPRDVLEACRLDGAGHLLILRRVVLPMLLPAMAAFAVLQFIWVWNDLLVALTFAGGTSEVSPVTAYLASLKASDDSLVTVISAGAVVALAVPLIAYASLRWLYLRGLIAAVLKGP